MKQEKNILKMYFETGDKPTQSQYENLIDSLRHAYDKIPLEDLSLEGYDEEGERDNGLIVRLGDFVDASNGTKIIITDDTNEVEISGNLIVNGDVDASTKTITAESFIGDGSQLTNLSTQAIPSNVAYQDSNNNFSSPQTINSGTTNNALSLNSSDNTVIMSLSDDSTTMLTAIGAVGDNLRLYTGDGDRYEIDALGNHDFKNGAASFGGNITVNDSNISLLKTTTPIISLESSSNRVAISDSNIGTTTVSPFSIQVNGTNGYTMDTSRNHDFKNGTALFGGETTFQNKVYFNDNLYVQDRTVNLLGNAPILRVDSSNGSSGLRLNVTGLTGGTAFRVQDDDYTIFTINKNGFVTTTSGINIQGNAEIQGELALDGSFETTSSHWYKESIYHATNGILIETDVNTNIFRMIELIIEGNSYTDSSTKGPIISRVQAYNHGSSETIIQTGALSNDQDFSIDIFHYNGKVCFWFEQTRDYQTYSFKTNTTPGTSPVKIVNVSNAIKPSSGVAANVNITPIRMLTSANISFEDLPDKPIWNWGTSRADITGLTTGSTVGTILESENYGHVAVGIRGNDNGDSFWILESDDDVNSTDTYTKAIMRVNDTYFQYNGNDVVHTGNIQSIADDNFVTLDTAQTITGEKTFSNAITIQQPIDSINSGMRHYSLGQTHLWKTSINAIGDYRWYYGDTDIARLKADGSALFNSSVTANSFVGNGAQVSNVDATKLDGLSSERFIYGNSIYGTENTFPTDGGIGANAIRRSSFYRDNNHEFGCLGIHVNHPTSINYALQLASTSYGGLGNIKYRLLNNNTWTEEALIRDSVNFVAGTDYVSIDGTETITGEKTFTGSTNMYIVKPDRIYLNGYSSGSPVIGLKGKGASQSFLIAEKNNSTNRMVDIVETTQGAYQRWYNNGVESIRINGETGDISASNFLGNWNGISSSDAVLKSTTGLGKTGSTPLTLMSDNAAWSGLPVGYSAFIRNSSYGLPAFRHYYFTKVANRDTSGGWGGILGSYVDQEIFWGYAPTSNDDPTWHKLAMTAHDNNFSTSQTFQGEIKAQNNVNIGYGDSTEYCVQVGHSRTTSGASYIDLISDSTTYTDYGFRMFRNAGANGATTFTHRGTGNVEFNTKEISNILFKIEDADKFKVSGNSIDASVLLSANAGINALGQTVTAANFNGAWNGFTQTDFVRATGGLSETITGLKTFSNQISFNDTITVNGDINTTLLVQASDFVASDGAENTTMTHYGIVFHRDNSYLRPTSNLDKDLWIGGATAGVQDWDNITFRGKRTNFYSLVAFESGVELGGSTEKGVLQFFDHSTTTQAKISYDDAATQLMYENIEGGEHNFTTNVIAPNFAGNWNGKIESDFIRASGNVNETIDGRKTFSAPMVLQAELSSDSEILTTGNLQGDTVKANTLHVTGLNSAPLTKTDSGTAGEIRFTSDHIYVCTATNNWKRVAIADW